MGKSKTTTNTTTNQNTAQQATPYQPILPGMNQLASNIQTAMGQAQAVPQYTGPFVATGGALQNAVIPAYQQSAALAQSLVNPALQASERAWTMPTFNGPSLDQGTQSFASYDASGVQPVIEAAMAPYLRQLTEQLLPGLQSSAIDAGAYSNDRAFAVMPQQALRDTSRMAAEVGAGVAYDDFQSQQNRQLQAYGLATNRGLGSADILTQRLGLYPELLDNVMRMSTGSADLTQQAASYDLAMRQAEINNALAADAYNVSAPFRGLDTAASLYGTFAPYASQTGTSSGTSTQTTTQKPSLAGQIMQGAMGLGSMALGMPGLFGSGAGGAAGAMMSASNPLMNMPAYVNPFIQKSPVWGAQFPGMS